MLQCPRECKINNLPENTNYCPICGSQLQKIESKKDKYQIVQLWLQYEFYNVASEKFNPRDQVLEILQKEAQCAVDKYLISGRTAIQIKYVKNVNSMGTPIHFGCLDLSFDRKRWYALFHPEQIGEPHWEYVKTCGCGQVKRFQRKYGLVDCDNVVILPCEYDDIQELPSGFIKFQKDGKYGLLNIESSYSSKNNEPKITMLADCQYDFVFDFKHGYAKVQKGKEWYMIDENGEIKMKQRHSNLSYKPSIWLPIEICDCMHDTTIYSLHELATNKIILGSTSVTEIDNLTNRVGVSSSDRPEHVTHYTYAIKNHEGILYGTTKNGKIIMFSICFNSSNDYHELKHKIEFLLQRQIIRRTDVTNEEQRYESNDSILKIILSETAILMEVICSNNNLINTYFSRINN